MGIGFDLTELAIDLELCDILEIDGQKFLLHLVIEQYSIVCNGNYTDELIIPHLAGEPETNTNVNVVFTYIDKDTF